MVERIYSDSDMREKGEILSEGETPILHFSFSNYIFFLVHSIFHLFFQFWFVDFNNSIIIYI